MARRWGTRDRLLGVAVGALAGLLMQHGCDALAVRTIVAVMPTRRDPAHVPPDVQESFLLENAGASLRVWLLEPTPPSAARGTVLLLHGIHDSKLSSLSTARGHVARGYRVAIWDARGHGESSGEYLTFGVLEARDARAIVDRLAQRSWLVPPLLVVGTSYGAATALQYAARDRRVAKVVAIAPFASMREVVPAYVRWFAGRLASLVPDRWLNARIDEAGRLAGFDPDQACPRCVAPHIQAAALIVASRSDERIPYAHAQAIHHALGARAELFTVEHTSHVAVGRAPGVPAAIAQWLDAPP
ncbi:MAG: alpha/beta fold hydrolase [Polyangiales bacterium]